MAKRSQLAARRIERTVLAMCGVGAALALLLMPAWAGEAFRVIDAAQVRGEVSGVTASGTVA